MTSNLHFHPMEDLTETEVDTDLLDYTVWHTEDGDIDRIRVRNSDGLTGEFYIGGFDSPDDLTYYVLEDHLILLELKDGPMLEIGDFLETSIFGPHLSAYRA